MQLLQSVTCKCTWALCRKSDSISFGFLIFDFKVFRFFFNLVRSLFKTNQKPKRFISKLKYHTIDLDMYFIHMNISFFNILMNIYHALKRETITDLEWIRKEENKWYKPSISVTRALMFIFLHLVTFPIKLVHLITSGSFSSNNSTRKWENVKSVVLPRMSINCSTTGNNWFILKKKLAAKYMFYISLVYK